MTITPLMLKQLRADLDAAVAGLAKKYDLSTLRTGKCNYDPHAGSFTFKLEGVASGAIGKEGSLYEQSVKLFGLPPLGWEFTHARVKFTTTGLNSTGTKVHCKRSDGQTYLVKTDLVVRLWKASQSDAAALGSNLFPKEKK